MAKKKNNRYSILWKRLHFKYRLSATNENTLDEVWGIKVSMFSGIILLIAFSTLIIFITAFIIIGTPIRYYLPGYLDSEVRKEAMQGAFHADSLEQQIRQQEIYINNLRNVLDGKMTADSVKIIPTDTIEISDKNPLLAKTEREKEFIKQYEEEEKYNLSALSPDIAPSADGTIFFKPVKGIISRPFNSTMRRYDIEIQTAAKESVLSVLDGTVIFAGYNLNDGYTVQIQHRNSFVSIYKQISLLLKKTGDRVKAGEAIAIIDGDKEAENSRLLLELWFKGNPTNPADYISF